MANFRFTFLTKILIFSRMIMEKCKMPRKILALFATIVVCGSVGLATGQNRSIKLLGLAVDGNKTADANLIRLNSGLSQGEEVAAEDVQNAIKQLWSLDMFSDIQVVVDRQVAEGVYLTIKVTEYPRLDKIELDGNSKIKKKDIDKELDFYKGQVLSPRDVTRTRRKLQKLYESKGYLLAEVNTEMQPSAEEGKVNLRVKIHEGKKVQIKEIHFHGSANFSEKKLRKQLKDTKQDGFFKGGDFDAEKYNKDKGNLLDFYRAEGFRDAEIVTDSVHYGADKKDMVIDFWVNEGTRYYFGDITWQGNQLFSDTDLVPRLGFRSGDVYSQKKLSEAISERLGALYYDSGYIYATINPKETPVDNNRVNIEFLVNEGRAVKIDKIRIAGNTKTKEKVIRRELFFRPGDTFSREALIRSQREVWVLNYFSDVKPDVQPVDDEKVDIVVDVTEKSTDTANMSAGWSERDKIIGSIGVGMNNLFGNGQRLAFDWNFGRSYRSFQLSFTEPWLFDTPTLAGFSVYDTKRSATFYGYAQSSQGGTLRIGRRFRWPDNYFRGDWIYRIDRTNLHDFSSDIIRLNPNGIVTEKWPLTSSSVTQIISRNSLNRPEFPTDGSQVSLSTELAGAFLGGNVSYHKHIFSAEWFSPIGLGLVLFNRFETGFIKGFGKNARIPYLEYFFMGGEGLSRSTPLRGYDDPLTGSGSRIGGSTMLKYSTEIRIPIAPNPTVFGMLFGEAGNTFEDFAHTNPFELRRSLGVGVRIFMPLLGVLGFDYAYGFDNVDPRTGKHFGQWKPHFVFGQSF